MSKTRAAAAKKTKEPKPKPTVEKAEKPKLRGKKAVKENNDVETKDMKRKRPAAVLKNDKESDETFDDEKETAKKRAKKTETKKTNDKPANKTETDYRDVCFTCKTRNAKGEAYNLKIASWNVDGLRSWLKKGGLEFLKQEQPDILCLQETKCSDKKLPDEIKTVEGYHTYWFASKKEGYAGTLQKRRNKRLL